MDQEKISQELRLKNIEETRNSRKDKSRIYIEKYGTNKKLFIKEIDQNELMSKKCKRVCSTLNYTEHFPILASAVTGCISIFDFASLLCKPIGITCSVI